MKGSAFRHTLKLCLKSTGNDYVHSWVHLSCHSVALHDPAYRLSISVSSNSSDACVDKQDLCVSACIHWQSAVIASTNRRGPSILHSFTQECEGGGGESKRGWNGFCKHSGTTFRFEHPWSKPRPSCVSRSCFNPVLVAFRGLWESWMCLDESF